MIRIVLAFTPLLGALAWSGALLADPRPWDQPAVLLIGIGLILNTTIAGVGLSLVGGRWARRLGLAALVATVPIAAARSIDVSWIVAVALSAVAALALMTPPLTVTLRKLPSATGPPESAVVVTLALTMAPLLLGLVSLEGAVGATLVVGLTGPLVGLAYARVMPGGYYLLRFAWPVLGLALAFAQPPVPAITGACLAAAVFALASTRPVRVAFYPPRETGSAFPIPPELAPQEILDAARLDEKGRRR